MYQSPEWICEALKQYFINRLNTLADTVNLVGYFYVAIVLDAVEDLVATGWLVKTTGNGLYPKLKRSHA
jgi:hypothetical protein